MKQDFFSATLALARVLVKQAGVGAGAIAALLAIVPVAAALGASANTQTAKPAPQLICAPDWSVASRIVADNNLVPIDQLTKAARDKALGKVIRTTLCRDEGRYVYRVVLRSAYGGLATITVDARKPFQP